jgi:natural product precursor
MLLIMKKLSKIKLNQLNKSLMEKRELLNFLGGGYGAGSCCGCGCAFYGSGGGSSAMDNGSANFAQGYYSPAGQQGCLTESGVTPSIIDCY